MILAKEQRIGAAILFGLALAGWLTFALWPSRQTEPAPKPHKKSWAERKDSIRIADSLRYVQWKEARERQYDSARLALKQRGEDWKRERQQIWDSMRLADSLWRDSVGWRYTKKIKKDTILDLNHCDTTELQFIRGIGRYSAVQIVKYREQLGGFYSLNQLSDEALSKCHLDTVLEHFIVNPEDVATIPINSCSIDRLQRHPYLRYSQAKAIYTLRRQRLRISSIDELRALPELTDEDLNRIEPYLSFE